MDPCFAIIDKNSLSRMALRSILWDTFHNIEVLAYNSMESFIRDSNYHFVHFFVSSELFFTHIEEFEFLKQQTTILCIGGNRSFEAAGFRVLDISLSEQELMKRLIQIQFSGISEPQKTAMLKTGRTDELSSREKEVLRLIIKGYTNKEISSALDISLPTAIFHRNNICTKLDSRSVGKMTIHAVLNGIIDITEI